MQVSNMYFKVKETVLKLMFIYYITYYKKNKQTFLNNLLLRKKDKMVNYKNFFKAVSVTQTLASSVEAFSSV